MHAEHDMFAQLFTCYLKGATSGNASPGNTSFTAGRAKKKKDITPSSTNILSDPIFTTTPKKKAMSTHSASQEPIDGWLDDHSSINQEADYPRLEADAEGSTPRMNNSGDRSHESMNTDLISTSQRLLPPL
jgi:hypothetical protein